MNGQNKNPHAAHRARVRARIKATGFDGMAEHNVLEYLLFYAIPRKDTNELAHRLIEEFGSLQQVLAAPYDRLLAVEGVGERTALFLTSYALLAQYTANCCAAAKRPCLEETEAVKEFLKIKYLGAAREAFYLLCLNDAGELLKCEKLGEGDADSVQIDKRHLLALALNCRASCVIFAHNHLNGVLAPSAKDIETTTELGGMLRAVGIRLLDHLIVTEDGALSLASLPKFHYLFL